MGKADATRLNEQVGDIGFQTVADPSRFLVPDVDYEDGILSYEVETRVVAVRLRDDVIALMYARHQLGSEDEARPRLAAARRWQSEYELSSVGRIRSSGDVREPVDNGGRLAEGINDRQLLSMRRVGTWRRVLGEQGHRLIVHVLVDQYPLVRVARVMGTDPTPATVTYLGHRLRESLDTLAGLMGYATQAVRGGPP
jgi:hypothetical protein